MIYILHQFVFRRRTHEVLIRKKAMASGAEREALFDYTAKYCAVGTSAMTELNVYCDPRGAHMLAVSTR